MASGDNPVDFKNLVLNMFLFSGGGEKADTNVLNVILPHINPCEYFDDRLAKVLPIVKN